MVFLYKHKKLNFEAAERFLEQQEKNFSLITDTHATYTLYHAGFTPERIVLEEGNFKLKEGKNYVYLNILYIVKGTTEFEKFLQENDNVIIIARDYSNFDGVKRINNGVCPEKNKKVYWF